MVDGGESLLEGCVAIAAFRILETTKAEDRCASFGTIVEIRHEVDGF